MRKRKNEGQAILEYVMVLGLVVFIAVFGFSIIKCNLYKIWVTMACEVFYPYPVNMDNTKLKTAVCNKDAVQCNVPGSQL